MSTYSVLPNLLVIMPSLVTTFLSLLCAMVVQAKLCEAVGNRVTLIYTGCYRITEKKV